MRPRPVERSSPGPHACSPGPFARRRGLRRSNAAPPGALASLAEPAPPASDEPGPPRRLADEWVRAALVADEAARTVAGMEADVVAERQELLPDRSVELLEVAAGEIGPPHRA